MTIRINNLFLTITISSIVLFFNACNTATEKKTIKLPKFAIVFEGPLYEGSNTAQYEIKNGLDSFLKANKISIENIKTAKLNLTEISSNDSNFNAIQSLTMQITSEKTDMIQLGVINPVPENTTNVKLNIAQTQEKLQESIIQPAFYIVVDAIVKKDVESNIGIVCDLEFEIETKK